MHIAFEIARLQILTAAAKLQVERDLHFVADRYATGFELRVLRRGSTRPGDNG
jgi:hypothetical protein